MRLTTLTLRNFRNFGFDKIYFNDGINILTGKNAQGKTNILEAINFCSYLKSFRAVREEQLIRFGADSAYIKLEYNENDENNAIEITICKDRPKELKLNGMTVGRNRELIGRFSSIIFTPDHLNLIKEGPNRRRAFLDMALCAMDLKYTDTLLMYQKVTAQRNALLRRFDGTAAMHSLLSVYDTKLCEYGAYIAVSRARYIEKLEVAARRIYGDISKTDSTLKLLYINQFTKAVETEQQMREKMMQRLEKVRDTDIQFGMTTSGVQKDDLLILSGGKSLKYFGSQGQIRSAVLSLILAEGDVIYDRFGVYPVLILDDILSELDRSRQKFILDGCEGRQCLLSCCESARARGKGNIIKVSNGRII